MQPTHLYHPMFHIHGAITSDTYYPQGSPLSTIGTENLVTSFFSWYKFSVVKFSKGISKLCKRVCTNKQ